MSSPNSESSTRGLLQRAKSNTTEAWQKLSRLYGPLVYQWGRRAGLQPSDAADVTQEVFAAVFQSIQGFQPGTNCGDSFRGWLWTITRNKIRDAHRRDTVRPKATGGSEAAQELLNLPDQAPENADEPQRVEVQTGLARRAMQILQADFEDTTWRAFWKTAVESSPAAVVAEELGVSTAAVYMAKSRVLRRLREELQGLMKM